LASDEQCRAYGAFTPEMFAQEKYNLENHFVLVGLTKWFHAFYLMACDHFGWKTRFYNRLEVSRNATPPEQITAATRDYIASHNQYDIQLFQFVETRVAAEIEAQGPLFQKRLKRYQTFNRMYQQGVKVRRFSVRTYIRQNWLRGQSPTD
ncbi:MAG: hypothetical protein KDE51_18820, partial [Anaerolineales bacterium]|nr:hypothetical protein [Anaerolineales bacterium]